MNIELVDIAIGLLVIVGITIYLVREGLIIEKRAIRKSEMKLHVEAIVNCGDEGCGFTERHYNGVIHIMEHYGVSLEKIGFKGSLNDFHDLACVAFRKYIEAFRTRTIEIWGANVEPDEMGIIGVPTIEGWDAINSVQLYAQARRRLKRLERQYRIFHSRAPIGGAVFLLQDLFFRAKINLNF